MAVTVQLMPIPFAEVDTTARAHVMRALHQMSTASKVFKTPELLSIVCAHNTRETSAQVLRTSKAGFLTAAPLVWNHVDDITDLLRLFPSLSFSRTNNEVYSVVSVKSFSVRVAARNNALQAFNGSNLDFSRFNVYAPFVTSVEIYRKHYFFLTGWSALVSSFDRRPILPKLSSLIIHSHVVPCSQIVFYVGWINWLLSPSLTGILVHGSAGELGKAVSPMEASVILQAIAEGCPHLERLSLRPSNSQSNDRSEEGTLLLGLMQTRPLQEHISGLRDLREFETSTMLCEPEFLQALGALPKLQSLKIFRFCEEFIPDIITFSPGAFPALRTLALTRLDDLEIIQVLDLLPAVSNLNSLELDAYLDTEDDWLRTSLFPRLGIMTRLTTLRMNLCFSFDMIESNYHNISGPGMLETLSTLPLEVVKLGGVIMLLDESIHLHTIFPNVRIMELSHNETHLHMLSYFAPMSKLEHLTIPLILREGCVPYHHNSPGNLSLHTLEISEGGKLACDNRLSLSAAETLLDIWPNLRRIVPPNPKLKANLFRDAVWLDATLSIVRKTRNLRAKIAEKCGWKEAESMIPNDFFSSTFSSD
ncbi:hypothetical protein FRC06_000105, partial [Ceratobasidium sp. 370]